MSFVVCYVADGNVLFKAGLWLPHSIPCKQTPSSRNVLHVADPGSAANGLASESTSKQANTLFQDIFGKTAFADVSVGRSSSFGMALDKSNHVAHILDVPAYLLPSVDTIFDTVVGSFLQPRPSEESGSAIQPAETPDPVHMEIEEPVFARSFVEDEEIGMLIHFFRDVAVKGEQDSPIDAKLC